MGIIEILRYKAKKIGCLSVRLLITLILAKRRRAMIKRISFAMLLLTGCSQPLPSLELVVENNHVDLAQQVEGGWDRVCILTPYTTPVQAAELTGLDVPDVSGTGIESSDSYNVLLFMKGGRLNNAYQVNRAKVEFNLTAPWCFDKEQSYLVVN